MERPESFEFRTGSGLVAGYGAGAITGAVTSVWSDVPVVLRDKPWPALARTFKIMNKWGLTYAAIGGTFAAVDVRRRP